MTNKPILLFDLQPKIGYDYLVYFDNRTYDPERELTMRSLTNLVSLTAMFLLLFVALPLAALAKAQDRPDPYDLAPTTKPALARPSRLAPLNVTANSPNCLVYPMVVYKDIIGGVAPDDKVDIFNGWSDVSHSGSYFGWVAWNPEYSVGSIASDYLRDELRYPQLSLNDYTNPLDPTDHILGLGGYVAAIQGDQATTESSYKLVSALAGRELIIPVWDMFSTAGNLDAYHVIDFALVRIESTADINLPYKYITATYLGSINLERCPYLTLTKSGPPTAQAGELITYTLTLTNSGNLTATGMVMTDTLPVQAIYISGGTPTGHMVSWTIPALAFGQSLSRTFSVTAGQTITNSDYAVRANGNITAAGSVPVVTTIAPELAITKQGPVTVATGSPITYTLWVTNNGGLATNLIITDAIPANAVYLAGGIQSGDVVSWTAPALAFGQSLSRTFSITAQHPVTNSLYRVTAAGNFSATGTISVTTTFVDPPDPPVDELDPPPIQIYLPLILKDI